MALAVTIISGMFAAEAKEYNAAVEFFEANCMSTEGMSRSEIKAVYRDSTTKLSAYNKTDEGIYKSISGTVIYQPDPTTGEYVTVYPFDSSDYRIERDIKNHEKPGTEVDSKYYLSRYANEEMVWQVEFDKEVDNCRSVSEGTVVWGHSTFPSSENVYSWVALVDESGNILWEHTLDHGFKNEYIISVLKNPDGAWEVLSRGDNEYSCVSQYEADWNERAFYKIEFP